MAAIEPSAAQAPQILIPLDVPVALPASPQVAQELIAGGSPRGPRRPRSRRIVADCRPVCHTDIARTYALQQRGTGRAPRSV